MDRDDYVTKLNNIVNGTGYKRLDKDPSQRIDNEIRSIVRCLKKLKNSPKNIASTLIGLNSRDPAIYGLPKIHKPETPLRPIISTYGSVYELTSKFIAKVLKYYLDASDVQTALLNSYSLVDTLKSHVYPRKWIMVSFDVVNLFGSLDQTDCKSIVSDLVSNDANFENRFQIPVSYFLHLLDICLKSSFFKLNDVFYTQDIGVPMGSSCSPALADLYMRNLERKILSLEEFKKYVDFWQRYVDDIISFWMGTLRQLSLFLNTLNQLDTNIQFTMEVEDNGSLPFLDILLTRSDTSIKTKMYEKPTSSGLIINFNSFHPSETKFNTLKGEVKRYLKLSDEPDEDLLKLKCKFQSNGFPSKAIDSIISSEKYPNTKPSQMNNPSTTLCLPYMGNLSAKLKKISSRNNWRLVSKKNKSLGSIFCHTSKENTNKPTNLVYKIPCSCGEFYVGETGKSLEKRISQHKYAVSINDPNNGLAIHVFEYDHKIEWDKAEILTFEADFRLRKIKESLFIKKLKPSLNLNGGFNLRGTWGNLT